MSAAVVILVASQALGQFEIGWHTVDGGGLMNSTDGQPGGFELSGTIGQHDAQVSTVMFGGAFELTGGFWVVATVCNCPGDMNGDGLRNGADIQNFAHCFAGAGACNCADVNDIGGVNSADVSAFVTSLLAGAACP